MTTTQPPQRTWQQVFSRRMLMCILIGFASGLPLALTGQAMQAWLTTEGVDLATIGFLGLVGLPYTFKFLWAPLMDRFEPPWLGRRRGWLVLTQLALGAMLWVMAGIAPTTSASMFALCAVAVAFLSASQDIVVDAYRTDLMETAEEAGLGASLSVFGYRLAMLVSGGLALIWADQWQSWAQVYQRMGQTMWVIAAITCVVAPSVASTSRPLSSPWQQELLGFLAMAIAVVAGYFMGHYALVALGLNPQDPNKWVQLLFVVVEIAVALPMAWYAARLAKFETLNRSMDSYFSQQGAAAFLLLIVLYKLGDAFAGSLTLPFLLKGMAYTQAEVGIANKLIGMWLTIFGGIIGGVLMLRLKLFKALLVFGVLQLLSNAGFLLLAMWGKGAWGAAWIQPFDWYVVALRQPASLDWLLLGVIAAENITGAMGLVAFVALLTGLCSKRFSATHYALLSAFAAVGRIYVSPLAGVLSETVGWEMYFVISMCFALPGLAMVWWMRGSIQALSKPLSTTPGYER
jgi:MFS transporter, PAT family, beta-lactamase induction signal transducer AmpG